MIKKLFKSRQAYTIAALFAINGVGGIHDQIPANLLPFVDGLLSMLALYFRVAPKQTFGGGK